MPSITKYRLAQLEKMEQVLSMITTRKLYDCFKTITKDEFYELLGDRYNIFYRTHFEDGVCPLPQYYMDHFIRTFKSDTRNYKTTIFANDGSIIKESEGIMCHDVLEDIMKKFGLEEHLHHAYSNWNGRQKIHFYLMDKCWEHIEERQLKVVRVKHGDYNG